MKRHAWIIVLGGLLAGGAGPAVAPTAAAATAAPQAAAPAMPQAAAKPARAPAQLKLGQCVRTRVASLGQRLMDARTATPIRGSGSVVRFSNLIAQVSYDQVGGIQRSRVGDPVELCLVQLPTECPAGDERGKIYKTTNMRTKATWTLPDSEHSCGGA